MSSYTDINGPTISADTIQGNGGALQRGKLSLSVAGSADVTLSGAQAANEILEFTGVITGNINVIVPLAADATHAIPYTIFNNTTGAFSLTVKGATGTGIVVGTGKRAILYADATNLNRVTPDT